MIVCIKKLFYKFLSLSLLVTGTCSYFIILLENAYRTSFDKTFTLFLISFVYLLINILIKNDKLEFIDFSFKKHTFIEDESEQIEDFIDSEDSIEIQIIKNEDKIN
ncbi:hypothetical protein HERIO_505 [Hepatospora eriocheir]|uniref:Uncharacterized protein n=1 Tax=Hepatospora eriocheir TaxID=1081669 RepID=A0A1X0QD15_9MICR|nr:hypothetical protein HERIO_505 [Hepatospora eriocheir]